MTEHTTFVDDVEVDDPADQDQETDDAVVHEDEASDPPADEEEAEAVESGELVVRGQEPEDMRSAIERAAEAAMENPGIPGRDEFLALAAQARILCMSAAAPKEVQNDPHLAFHIAMIGRDLQISPSAALELIDVIPGSNDGKRPPQLSLSPQLLNGQIRRLGLGSIVPAIKTDRLCVAVVLGPDGRLDPRCKRTWPNHWRDELDPTLGCGCRDQIGDYEFSWEDAQMAGLAGPECQPGEHTQACKNWVRGTCATGYKNYPKRMMWWRASGFAADDYFPEAGLGLYTAEELGSVVDQDGRPVDPATVELPPGYEPKEIEQQRVTENKPADPEVIAAFEKRIAPIKANEEASAALRNIWTAEVDGHPRLPPLPKLRERHVPIAEAAISSVEAQAKKGTFALWVDPPEDGEVEGEEAVPDVPTADPETVPDAEPATEETGQADEGPSSTGDPIVDQIVDEVRAMDLADVIDELGHRDLTVRGNEQAKRQRLAQARYEERVSGSSSLSQPEDVETDQDEGESGDGDTEAVAEDVADGEQGTLDA